MPPAPTPTRSWQFLDFVLDVDAGTLRRGTVLVALPPQRFALLLALVQSARLLVTRETLCAPLWGDDVKMEVDAGLDFCVRRLRRALGDEATQPRFFQTVPRRGYRFIAPVIPAQPMTSPSPPMLAHRLRHIAAVALACVAALGSLVTVRASGAFQSVARAAGLDLAASQSAVGSSLEVVGRGVVSTAAPEFATTLTPDGRELYFNRASDDRSRLTIMTARRTGDSWSTPMVASFSGTHRDVDPFVTPDGRRLYFSSDRPRNGVREPRFATWYVDRRGEGWGDPVDPGAPLNSDAGDVFVSVARDGLMLFTSSRLGSTRIFSSKQVANQWEVPQPVTLGTETDGGNPAIAPSGRFAVLVRTPDGAADLFVSCRTPTGWGPARALEAINSAFADFAPFVDAAEQMLYFTSERPGLVAETVAGARPPGDLYRVTLRAAGIQCP